MESADTVRLRIQYPDGEDIIAVEMPAKEVARVKRAAAATDVTLSEFIPNAMKRVRSEMAAIETADSAAEAREAVARQALLEAAEEALTPATPRTRGPLDRER